MSYTMAVNGYVEGGCFTEPTPPPTVPDNCFKWAEDFVHEMMELTGSISITYVRGGVESLPILAAPAMTIFRYFDKYNISQREEVRDYLVNVPNLIHSGIAIEPKQGDTIIEIVGTTKSTYRVSSPGNEPSWRHSGYYKGAYRIHTKHVITETI